MAALPRRFGPDVSDTIMRFAVGYPRDRLRDIANDIERIEYHDHTSSLLHWRHRRRHHGTMGTVLSVAISHRRRSDCFIRWELRDEDRVKYYGEFCDACEPVELQLQRTHF